MSIKPSCFLDNQPCDRVCVYQECTAPVFICKNNSKCENIHKHSCSLASLPWIQIQQLNNDAFKKTDQFMRATLQDVTEKVETIIAQMRQTLTRYVEHLNEIRCSLKLKPEVADVRNKLSNGDYSKITGKEMAAFYNILKNGNQFENKQQVFNAVAKLNQKGYKLMASLRKKIADFLHKDHEQRFQQKQNNGEKLIKLTQRIKTQPNNPDRYFQRGLEYSRLGKLRQAEEDYNTALSLKPNFVDALLNRGIIFYNLNRFSEAEQDYNLAIQLDPSNSKAFNNRGRLFHDCRKSQEAQEDYKKAIALSPSFVKCYLNRAMLYSESHRLKEAEDDYTRVIQLDDSAKAFANRGLLRFHQGKYDQAERDYNRAIELDPTNDGTFNNRGYLFFTVCKYDKALSDYNRAITLKPKALYYKNRSDTQLKLGDQAEAKEDLKRALQMKTKSHIA